MGRVFVSLWAATWLGLASSGCADDAADRRDIAVIEADILDEIQRLNFCDEVSDCSGVSFPTCSTSYINSDADRTNLAALLEEWRPAAGDMQCPASCQCGLLRCTESSCVTSAGNCMETPDEATLTICL